MICKILTRARVAITRRCVILFVRPRTGFPSVGWSGILARSYSCSETAATCHRTLAPVAPLSVVAIHLQDITQLLLYPQGQFTYSYHRDVHIAPFLDWI